MSDMSGLIKDIKDDLIKFFVNEEHDLNMVLTLEIRLGYPSLEFAYNGLTEINNKYGDKHPYLISANKDESILMMFVCRAALHEDACSISFCCSKGDKIYGFVSDHGEAMIPMKQFKGKSGDDMISAFLKFRHGVIFPCLKPATDGAGYDILKFKRSLKAKFKRPGVK